MPTTILHSTETHESMPTAITALYRITHSHACLHQCAKKKHTFTCPLPKVHSSETHTHRHNAYCTLQNHIFTCPLLSCTLMKNNSHAHCYPDLYRNIHSHAYCKEHCIETHIHMFTAYCTLQKHTFTCPLPSINSKEIQFHMTTAKIAFLRNIHRHTAPCTA